MLKVLTAEQMREVDRLTTERYGIPSIILMENAAHAVARVITERLGGSVKGKSILVLCGKGNNGGDGAALARILWKDGASVFVLLLGSLSDAVGDSAVNFRIMEMIDDNVLTSGNEFNKSRIEEQDNWAAQRLEGFLSEGKTDVYVDALFGTGLSKPLTGFFADAIQQLENHRPFTVSIDMPSGLVADSSDLIGPGVTSDITVTFTSPKTANVLPPASNRNGNLVIANIGSPAELVDEQPSQLFLAGQIDAATWLEKTKFGVDSYKNKRGHAVVVAGSENYSGAAVMCGNAAMRSGVGLTTLCVPESVKTEIASRTIPEVIVRAIAENENGEIESDAFEKNSEVFGSADAIAVGCGLSATDKGVEKLVSSIVESRKVPVIVDAGALWFFSPFDECASPRVNKGGTGNADTESISSEAVLGVTPLLTRGLAQPLILTPHEGEFLRLLGTDDKEAIKDRVAAVRDFATKNDVILVLKGERVLIGEPGGKVVVNPTGNSGLGKAGNGDTLAGILLGFVAQASKMKIDIFETVVAAVYVAGMAGDVAEKKFGKRVMTASDVRECLVEVFETLSEK